MQTHVKSALVYPKRDFHYTAMMNACFRAIYTFFFANDFDLQLYTVLTVYTALELWIFLVISFCSPSHFFFFMFTLWLYTQQEKWREVSVWF